VCVCFFRLVSDDNDDVINRYGVVTTRLNGQKFGEKKNG